MTSTYTSSQDPQEPEPTRPEIKIFRPVKRNVLKEPGIKNGHLILYQRPNFYVRTTNRRGRRPNPLRSRTGHTTLIPKVVPEQEKRIVASETRLMPQVEPINPVSQAFPIPVWLEAIVVTLGLLAGLVVHAYNLFYFPHYELDEGTYMSSAWAIIHGMITPYPYGYGHPPLGWIQIAAWIQLTGGFFTFGNALNSGRVLMLLYAFGSSLLVYLFIRRLEGSRSAALLAMLIFSLSPLSILYQRQVFLDNIGTFWLLLALYLLIISESRLLYIVLAAICFGISILSKEIFVLFIPAMIYAVWLHTTRFQRKFSLVAFTYTVISIGSSFVLMAVLKGELFPAGMLPWDHHPHLSMLDTFFQQVQRGQSEGSFSVSWAAWTENDLLLITFSIVATLFNLVTGWWNRRHLLLSLLAISYWVLLVRGGVIFPFYIIPLLPLVSFNTASAIHTVLKWTSKLTRSHLLRVLLLVGIILAIISYDMKQAYNYADQRPALTQTHALLWLRNHVSQDSVLVINSYFYTDLHEEGGEGVGDGAIYPYAHIYWNVAYDPEIHDGLLKNDWNRIDYIVTDPAMLTDIRTRGGPMSIIDQALDNSVLRAEFQAQDRDQNVDIRIYQVMHKPAPQVVNNARYLSTTPLIYNDRKHS
jgi:4-amino-4-deoxy-L-arabinose transferase-like glycosyltransferase